MVPSQVMCNKLINYVDSLIASRERVDDFLVFDFSSQFCFLLIEFHCTFSISYIMFIIIIVFS